MSDAVRLVINLTPSQFALILEILDDQVIVWRNDSDEFTLASVPKLLFRLVKDTP